MSRIEYIRPKLDWAVKHIEHLETLVAGFHATKPYKIGPLYKPDCPERFWYFIAAVDPVPPAIPLVVGDVLHNLRCVLDHLAFQLVVVNGKVPDKHTAFPIYDCAEKYRAGANGQVKLMSNDAIFAIDRVEPYKGGRGEVLWKLHQLNNIDKHHLLFATLGAMFAIANDGDIFLLAERQPLYVGQVLCELPVSEKDKDVKFAVDVAFAETGVCDGESLIVTVKHFADVVANLLTEFDPLL